MLLENKRKKIRIWIICGIAAVLLAVLLLLNHLPRRLFAKAAVFDDWDAYYAFLDENKHEGYTVSFSGGEGLLLLAIPLTLLLAAAAYAVLLHRACRQK